MIPQSQIDEIISKNDIVSVISEYVQLKRSGANHMGLCPFHGEKTPSFSVNESKQIFKCFGCGKGGGVVQFIEYAEGLDWVGAIQFLASRAGITLKDDGRGASPDAMKLKNDIISLNKMAGRFYYENLRKSSIGQEYFKKRGLSAETVTKFGLGFANDNWTDLVDHFTKGELAVKPELLVTAGLALKSDKNGSTRYYDKFRNRVMFPIFDAMGDVIAFGGRVMTDEKPKYLNSSDTPAFTKGNNLYGLNFARKAGTDSVIVVEGYMDCIALHQNGIPWTVAALGTAFTQNQARLLKRYFKNVYVGFDSDAAGQGATIRGLEILESEGLKVRVLNLGVVDPNAKDADEFLRTHTKDDYLTVVEKSLSLTSFKIKTIADRLNPRHDATKLEFLMEAARVIAREPMSSARHMYINQVCEMYGADQKSLEADVESFVQGKIPDKKAEVGKRFVKKPATDETNNAIIKNKAEAELDRLELRLLIFLADNQDRLLELDAGGKVSSLIENQTHLDLFGKLVELAKSGEHISRTTLMTIVGTDISGNVAQEMEYVIPATNVRELISLIQKTKRQILRTKLMKALAETQDPNEKAQILAQIQKLNTQTN